MKTLRYITIYLLVILLCSSCSVSLDITDRERIDTLNKNLSVLEQRLQALEHRMEGIDTGIEVIASRISDDTSDSIRRLADAIESISRDLAYYRSTFTPYSSNEGEE